MVQLQCMNARLDTLFTELYRMNIHVGHIAWRQAIMGGFSPEASLSPPIAASNFDSEDEDDDDSDDYDASNDDDGDASSLPMRCLLDTLPFVTCDKKGE